MKTIEISYNPYRMTTKMTIDGIDVCQNESYEKFKEFINSDTPLQTWIEPIVYLDWNGFVNEISDPEINDEIKIIFNGRKIDFDDFERSIRAQNENRSLATKVKYHFKHNKKLDDKKLSQNIDEVVNELKSPRFQKLIEDRTSEGLIKKYNDLEKNYNIAKENEFYIVLAGIYSSGKSTLLNTLIRHEILPTSSKTTTTKNCRIRHDSTLGNKISLTCYDSNENIILEKRIFDTDLECANEFLRICPIPGKETVDKYPEINMMEIGVDLSHLYPNSVDEDNFTIVLVDTPGMNSVQSIQNGINKHAQIALDAISMESKPMIIICTDADKAHDVSIGLIMKEIVAQAKEEGSGFNDRFLFLMNKSDSIQYNRDETAEDIKKSFAEYLTDSSKYGIKEEDELKELAEEASHFIPRIYMTSSIVDFAIQKGALDFTDEELDNQYNDTLNEELKKFIKKVCVRKRTNFYLSRYCDNPNYRKEEIELQFKKAIEDDDQIKAAKLQDGIVSVEIAIKDYIERYAYPIKVRGLLDTFEDILEDVNSFTSGILSDLKTAKKELGEKNSERKEVTNVKEHENQKIAVLEKAKETANNQLKALNDIKFDSTALKTAMTDLRADIEENDEIDFIRHHAKVYTGQKTRSEVMSEINDRITRIEKLFDESLNRTNSVLQNIKNKHDKQILEIFDILKKIVSNLESSGVFDQGEYKFTNSVIWKMNFSNINSDNFSSELKKKIVDKSTTSKQVKNSKKAEWSKSWNPFKKIGSWFMEDYETVIVPVDGYYETTEINQNIAKYIVNLEVECKNMQNEFEKVMDNSKSQVIKLANKLLNELTQFNNDIKVQERKISELSTSIDKLNNEIKEKEDTHNWLNKLSSMIKEGE